MRRKDLKRLALSATLIQSFNKFYYYDGEEEDFLASVKKEVKQTDYMRAGSAINLIINKPTDYYVNSKFSANGMTFHLNDIRKITNVVDYNFPFWEIKAFKAYNFTTNNEVYEANVTGVVDQLAGYKVIEFKTAWSSYNGKWRSFIEEYNNSVQHIFYADIFNVRTIEYKVFVFDGLPTDGNTEKLLDVVEFTINPTSTLAMRAQIDSILADMLDYLEKKDLVSYLETTREYNEYF
jgi:hypothetical protein